jgi:hypothetical protein
MKIYNYFCAKHILSQEFNYILVIKSILFETLNHSIILLLKIVLTYL